MQLFWLVLSVLARPRADTFVPVTDLDAADAVTALTATLETAERGVIYEQRAGTLSGQHIAADLNRLFGELAQQTGRSVDRDALAVLRGVTRLFEGMRQAAPGDGRGALGLVARLARSASMDAAAGGGRDSAPPSLILP